MTTQTSFLATRRGKLTLALLAAIGFLDFADSSIVNIALPHIRADLGFSVQSLQWVLSGYLLTYGGFMLLGGRMADLLGRRRVLVAGTALFAVSSLVGGLAQSPGMLVGARLAQGLGAATMMPAALSLLTTSFGGADRAKALGVWGAMAGLASAAGVSLGGLLTEGPGWRWVLFVNPPIAALLLVGVFALVADDRRRGAPLANFDLLGTLVLTAGMLLLVFGLVKAPDQGWGAAATIAELAGALALLVVFTTIEARVAKPLIPLSIFRVPGLAAADVTALVAVAGFLAMFFFLTIYAQSVLGYSPLRAAVSYLPLTAGVVVAAGVATPLIARIGTRPVLVGGIAVAAFGMLLLSRISADGTYVADLLPGFMVIAFGLGAGFVAVTTAANAGVPADRAGLAAALLNAAQQVGGALGLAILSAIATARTHHLAALGDPSAESLTGGFRSAMLVAALILLAAAALALRTRNSRGEHEAGAPSREGAPLLGRLRREALEEAR
ncbi:MAG TPA: MFS transporter [Solirubrobacteraceae bacterium]|nr:MFS transporter [Solirubrobacteraceae bacterium]